MEKRSLSERDICSKFVTPAIKKAGWDENSQIREEVSFTNGRIIVRGKLVTRGQAKRADYVLYYRPNIPIAIVEAKDNNHSVGETKGVALHVNVGDFRRMPIPVPPLAEQHRIVAKVDELMSLCDRLEAQLSATQTESSRLLEAVLHQALAPAA